MIESMELVHIQIRTLIKTNIYIIREMALFLLNRAFSYGTIIVYIDTFIMQRRHHDTTLYTRRNGPYLERAQ